MQIKYSHDGDYHLLTINRAAGFAIDRSSFIPRHLKNYKKSDKKNLVSSNRNIRFKKERGNESTTDNL